MKYLCLIFLSTISFSSSFAAIEGVSNISEQRVVINALDEDSSERKLVLINLNTLKKETISLPQIPNEEIIGMVLFKDHILAVSQWTTGGGKDPKIHQFNLKSKKWSEPTEVFSCLSFDTLEIKKSVLKIFCENQSPAMVKLGFNASASSKVVLPIQTDKDKNIEFKLSGGSMFRWEAIEIRNGKNPPSILKTKSFFKRRSE